MEDDTTFVEYFPFPSGFEDESDSSDEDPDKLPHEGSDQEGPEELDLDEVDPDQEAPGEVDPDKFNPRNAALHEREVAVLDALAYVSVNESSPAVAIGLTMKPLQLVVSTNKEIPSTAILKHLGTICSTLQNISDAKFCTCSEPNSQSNADLREESTQPDFLDENLECHYNKLFLQIYKYSHDRVQPKNKKRWEVIDGFRNQLTDWKTKVTRERGNRSDLDELQLPHKTFFNTLNDFCLWGFGLRDCLDQFSQSGWKMDADEMHKLKSCWHQMLACAKDVLFWKTLLREIECTISDENVL